MHTVLSDNTSASIDDLWSEDGRRLPPNIYLGTSTWAFPDWKGIVYRRQYKNEKEFRRLALEEYVGNPWFRTVCIDSFFYNPPKREALQLYASQVTPGFKWVSKIWERITIPAYPYHPKYGEAAGKLNADFLNADLLCDAVLSKYDTPEILSHTGPFVFQFPHIDPHVMRLPQFVEKLDGFLSRLPNSLRYAIEVRNAEFLTPEYFSVLNKHLATHCFNHWNGMIPLIDQMKGAAGAGGLTAPFYVARLLTPLGVSYERAAELYEPYIEIKQPNFQMRSDVARLCSRGIERNIDVFVTANNKAEGNSPLTIASIGRMVLEGISAGESAGSQNM